jgi:cell division protein FtsZ
VVVGTVLDPDMTDELRVTVIATGVNSISTQQQVKSGERPPIKIVPKTAPAEKPAAKVAKASDYKEYDKPTVARLHGVETKPKGNTNLEDPDNQLDSYLDIPSFLRRQAD